MHIRIEDPRDPQVVSLLREHLADMALLSPPESVHALNVDALCSPKITFWSVRNGHDLCGCGALLALDESHGEIKSMRTARPYLRTGVASRLLEHILAEARLRAYLRLSLETGSMQAFAPAHALYRRFGFEFCEAFGSYRPDPYSVFMTLALPSS